MSKIEELDIDQVTQDICDFYTEEGEVTSFHYVKELVELWSKQKYQLYLKMGRRLRVSSKGIETGDLSASNNFDSLASEIIRSHKRKSVGGDLHEDIFRLTENIKGYVISHPEAIDKIRKNEALKDMGELEDMVIDLTNVYSTELDDSHGWGNQARLTRQVSMVMRDMKSALEDRKSVV